MGNTATIEALAPADERLLLRRRQPDEDDGAAGRLPVLRPAGAGGLPAPSTRTHIGRLVAQAMTAAASTHPSRLAYHARLLAVREYEMGTVFLLMPVFAGAGVVAYRILEAEPKLMPLMLGVLLFGAVAAVCARISTGAMMAAAIPLLFMMGMATAKIQTLRMDTVMLGSAVATELSGYVRVIERRANGRSRLTIDVTQTARPALRYQPARVRVTVRGSAPFHAGDYITGRVRLMPHYGPVYPGSFDFAYDAYFDGVGANGFMLGKPSQTAPASGTGRSPADRFHNAIQNLRLGIASRVTKAAGDGAGGTVAAALVTGVTSAIPDEATETLRVTGLAHILSISGLHMALVAALFLGGLRAIMALSPEFVARHPTKKYAAAGALCASLVYLMLAGNGVATQRSFIMLAVMLLAVLCDRAALTMRNLAIAAFAVLAIAPHEVAGPSFQMSFAATAALIAAYSVLARRKADRNAHAPPPGHLGRRAAASFGRGTAALALTASVGGTATALYSAYHFHTIAPLGLVANVLTMPLISLVVMPAGVAGVLMIPFGLDQPCFAVMGWGIEMMLVVAGWVRTWSGAGATGMISPVAIALATGGFCILVLMQTPLRLAGIPLLAFAAIPWTMQTAPSILISDDAKLVAVHTGGVLAINRSRPNEFTMDIWQKALGGLNVVPPATARASSAVDAAHFVCEGQRCGLDLPSGLSVVHLSLPKQASGGGNETAAEIRQWCGRDAVVIVADATQRIVCKHQNTIFVTARDLARRGSATVTLDSEDGRMITVRHAFDSIERPWSQYRRYARAARGLEERPQKADKKMMLKSFSNGG